MINKKFMKDREYEYVLITYQGDIDSEKTMLFYVKNKKQDTEIGTIKRTTDGRYGFYKQGGYFDEDCMKDIRSFLDELNKQEKKK